MGITYSDNVVISPDDFPNYTEKVNFMILKQKFGKINFKINLF